MTRRVSLGVVGLGSIAQIQHLPHLLRMGDRFRITAIADISPHLTEAIADRLPDPVFTSTDGNQIISHPDVEAVLILHTGAHEQVTHKALLAGKHVFAEKPLCLTAAAARDLHIQATEKGLVLQVGYMKLHEEVLADLRTHIQQIGELRLARHTVHHPPDEVMLSHIDTLRFDDANPDVLLSALAFEENRTAEALGGLAKEWGPLYRNVLAASFIHGVSLIRGVFGSLPHMITADMWPDSPPRSPTEPPCLLAVGHYPDHTQVELSWLWLPSYPTYRESLQIFGSQGSLNMQFANPYLLEGSAALTVNLPNQTIRYQGSNQSPFARELVAFHNAVTTGSYLRDALGAAEDTAWLQKMVIALAGHRQGEGETPNNGDVQ